MPRAWYIVPHPPGTGRVKGVCIRELVRKSDLNRESTVEKGTKQGKQI